MKTRKNIFALFLALMMTFSLMAVTAAAYSAEEHDHDGACSVETIQPRKPGAPECLGCGQIMTDMGFKKIGTKRYIHFHCMNCGTDEYYPYEL